jgi:4-amino-4-deoxy-L-arabinose transferase-like glycosyltransferase
MRREKIGLLVVLGGLVAYLAAFFATRLPSLEEITGDIFRRGRFFVYFFEPHTLLSTLYAWFGAPGEAAVLDRLPVLALAAAILAFAAVLGWLLMVAARADRGLRRLEVFVFSMAVGLGAMSTYVLAAGLAGALRYRALFMVPALVTLFAAGWARKKKWGDRERGRRGDRAETPATPTQQDEAKPLGRLPLSLSPSLPVSLLWLAAPFVLLILLGSMLPPLDFDVREYHLQVPKEFFEQGRIAFLPHNVYGNMTMGTEMLSLLGMVLANDWWLGALVGKTVIGAFAPLTALGLFAAGRRFLTPAAGVVAAIAYLSTPWIARVSTSGLVEGASACYLLLAVYAVLLWKQGTGDRGQGTGDVKDRIVSESHPSSLILGGFLAGSAVSTKYPAALFVFVPLAVWVLLVRVRTGWPDAVKALLVFTLAAAAACGLWFGKNGALAGNPTYPLLYEVFDGPKWSPEKNARWNRAHRPHDFSLETLASDAGRAAVTSEWLSPILMPLALLGLVSVFLPQGAPRQEPVRTAQQPRRGGGKRKPPRERASLPAARSREIPHESGGPAHRRLAVSFSIYVLYVLAAWWLLTHRIDRFWIPVLPLVALLAGLGACWSSRRAWRWAVVGLLLIASVYGLLVDTSGAGGYNRFFVSLDQLRVSPDRVGRWHTWLNTYAADGRVLLVGDAEAFDLVMPLTYNTAFDDSIFERLAAGRSAEEIRQALVSSAIKYVFVDWAEIARYRSPGNYGFTDFVRPELFQRLVSQGVLRPLPPPPGVENHPGQVYEVIRSR